MNNELRKTVGLTASRAGKLSIVLGLGDGAKTTVRFTNARAGTRNARVLRALMDYPARNKPYDDGFIIDITDEECETLIAEAEKGERKKAFAETFPGKAGANVNA